jgi:hypothetical protein
MKLIVLAFTLCFAAVLNAQSVLNNVIIKAKMETVREGGNDDDGGMRMMGNNETEMAIYIRDSMTKVTTRNAFMNNITITDKATGISTILTESQGEKSGYAQTAADREAYRLRMDSIRKAQQENGGEGGPGRMVIRMGGGANKVKNIEYVEETKVINTINCKKAIVTSVDNENVESKVTVWYSDAYVLPKGLTGMRMMNFGDLKGLPIMYETSRTMNIGGNELTMVTTYQVTEIKANATIEDKEFAIPKGYKIKTYSEWIKDNPNGMQGGGRVFRIGG